MSFILEHVRQLVATLSSAATAEWSSEASSDGSDVGSDSSIESGKLPSRELSTIVCDLIRELTDGEPVFTPIETSAFQEQCRAELRTLDVEIPAATRWLPWACQLIEWLYPTHPQELKVLIVLVVIMIFHVDDVAVKNPQILEGFQLALLRGESKGDPILDLLARELLPRMWQHFEPLAASAIAIGCYDFHVGTALELVVRDIPLVPHAPQFPEFVRHKSGIPIPFAHWMFYGRSAREFWQALPDVVTYIDHTNDILSFYKEELAGDFDNTVHMRATSRGKGVLETLEELCAESIAAVRRAEMTLERSPEAQKAFKTFVIRYIHFHTVTSRYRLHEILN